MITTGQDVSHMSTLLTRHNLPILPDGRFKGGVVKDRFWTAA